MDAHQSGKGARYTRSHKPLRLLASAPVGNKSQALKAELAIKRLPKNQKLPAIQTLALQNTHHTIELQTHESCDWSVIWMHGLGADGSDFVPILPELGLDPSARIRFVFPNAPAIPVTCNGGYVMPAWYDIISLDKSNREVDVAGIVKSRQQIRKLIEREMELGIPSHRIFIAGFSQGGAVAYTTALTHPEPLAGIIALSTYLPVQELVTKEATEANRRIPIFIGHGLEDDVVSLDLGLSAYEFLSQNGYACQWQDYPMPHSVCIEEIQDIGTWLNCKLAT